MVNRPEKEPRLILKVMLPQTLISQTEMHQEMVPDQGTALEQDMGLAAVQVLVPVLEAASTGGSGNGIGSGAGLGQGSRELLTIPEKTVGKENKEIDGGQLGEGTAVEQSEGSGPVLKGTIRPYEEVFGEYEKSYRESSDRYQLPGNLEKIVQSYFTTIDPNGE